MAGFLDQNTMFDPTDNNLAQAFGASYNSAQSIDTGVAGTPILGGPLFKDYGRTDYDQQIVVTVTQTFASAGAATLQIKVVQADDAAVTTNVETLREGRALAAGNQGTMLLVAGTQIYMGQVPSMARRYLGLQYAIGVANTTAGKVQAGLQTAVGGNTKSFLAGY